MVAEILCVGTEILLGNIVNTNASYLARKCAEWGFSLFYQQVVGDNEKRLLQVFEEALSRSDVIITSGGLGSTDDDLTKETVCRFLGLALTEDEASFSAMQTYFDRAGRGPVDGRCRKQALIPEGGRALPNANGTAPGILIETDKTAAAKTYPGKIIILLPGPPGELIPITEAHLDPYFHKISAETIHSVMLKLSGIWEAEAVEKIDSLIRDSVNPTVAPYAKIGEVHLRLTAKADSEEAALSLIRPVEEKIREALGNHIYTDREELALEDTVISLAKEKGVTISAAESCTGGLVCGTLINVSGASDCIRQGFVTYSNEAKMSALGVSSEILAQYGAVSAECAMAMAKGAAEHAGAEIAVSTTGIAGPDGGTPEKPVGLVYIGIHANGKTYAERFLFTGSRRTVRDCAVAMALHLLWKELR